MDKLVSQLLSITRHVQKSINKYSNCLYRIVQFFDGKLLMNAIHVLTDSILGHLY